MRIPLIVGFIVTCLALVVSIFLGGAIAEENYDVPVLLFASALGLTALLIPELLVCICVATFAAGIYIPFLPGNISLTYIAMGFAWLPCLLRLAFSKVTIPKYSRSHAILFLFSILVIFVMFYRGFGFRFSDAGMVGGGLYIRFLLVCGLAFLLPIINIPALWWPRMIFLLGILALLQVLAEVVVVYYPALMPIWSFIRGSELIVQSMYALQSGGDMIRITSSGAAAGFLLIGALAIQNTQETKRIKFVLSWLLVAVGFGISLFSGSRNGLIFFFFVIILHQCLVHGIRIHTILVLASAFILSVAFIYLFAPMAPPNIQRTFAWLPGIDVPDWVKLDAWGTIDWRFELWMKAITMKVPDFLWIGEGLAYDEHKQMASLMMGTQAGDNFSWALDSGAYHNGPLGLLIAYGIPGLLLGSCFLIGSAVRHYKLSHRPWKNHRLWAAHVAILSAHIYAVIFFFIIWGDAAGFLTSIVFYFAVLEGLVAADHALADDPSSNEVQSRG